jgi:antirestriction protein ArdC
MSEEFKPLAEQTSTRMASLLNDNRSIFTKPMKEDGTSQFVMPINARTKQPYKGAAALVLLMQNRRDPRWLSYDQARFNKTPVRKGAYGTMIEFPSTNELRQKMENGQLVSKENGQPKMERVKLEEPVTVQAFLFNGKDLINLKNGEVKPPEKTPMERAQAILDNSGVRIGSGLSNDTYDMKSDMIYMQAKQAFKKPELYYAGALHQLAHWTAHESRLNRPDMMAFGFDHVLKEELRANIASILISAQLNLPYDFGEHVAYTKDWAKMLKDEPQELFRAAADAQQIADYVMKLEVSREQKQDTKQTQTAGKLAEGMEIDYNNTTYKILQKQSKGAFKIEDLTTGEKIKITPANGLYKSLLNQLNNPGQAADIDRGRKQDEQQQHEEEHELAEAAEETATRSRRR